MIGPIRVVLWGGLNQRIGLALAAVIALLLAGCLEPDPEARILVENDSGELAGRVTYTSVEVPIDTQGVAPKALLSAPTDSITLVLVAEVAPPVHEGQTLQATDVVIKGGKAYVSYNYQGEIFLGGVDIFDITDISTPQLISFALLTDTDVNGLAVSGDQLFLAAATERADYDSPAVLEQVILAGGLLTDETTIVDLPSYAATDVEVAGGRVYVTSGADGGRVTILSKDDLAVERSYSVEDARGVSADRKDVAVVAGTPARLLTFDLDLGELVFDYTLTGATIPFSKSTIEINRSNAILALGDGGTQIVCLATGETLAVIPQPIVAGLDSSVTVTNAATVDKKTLFMANGEAGVYVARAVTKLDSKDCSVDNLRLIGKFRFGDFQSVNHVAYKSGVLFIAGGLGGLKIVTVEEL